MTTLLDDYHAWSSGTKIELVNGQLVVGDCLSHSLRLLSQILRGWEIEAIVALAPELLWWQALSQTFAAPTVTNLDGMDASTIWQWADAIDYEPDVPSHTGSWTWSYSQLRQAIRMALFGLGMRYEKLGQSLGGGFVNRLGNNGFMPDVLFFRGEPRNRLYEYYLDGAADIVVEFIQPGCEDYIYTVKKPIYEAAGVPELWIFDVAQRRIELFRLIEGAYQLQSPDATGRYAVSSVPGLTFFPDRIWQDKSDWDYPLEETWFEVATDAPRLTRIKPVGEGVDWSKALLKFPIALDPVAIAFDDYIYWCPEAKFEFVNGRPDIGGRDGIKGLAGMLLMTFGLKEAVKLAHPRAWVTALLEHHAKILDPNHKAAAWKLAQDTATF
ncbi:Uma2 family endonuclease [Leptodesmis sichuanensis]|uniref:Uma2 family endonuclease n=1 Tax=Leptodesmis sichuanensis TaxID=2906798 RepID=UPI001F159DC6|nr:Uma2 family endonuclease [Leptodesmis sichuanensis]UIE38883.1 Uma2 family endonuclease [Leptodesmis sichuanensis A121]